MKKLKVIAILLASAAFAGFFSGCGGGEETADTPISIPDRFDAKYATTDWRYETEGEYLIGDWEDEFEYLFLGITGDSSTFGKLELSDEQATRGDQSLKVTVYGDGKFVPNDTENVYFRIDSDSNYKTELNLIDDYTPYACIKFDFYNAMEVNSMVEFYINQRGWFYSFEAKPGWNNITVPLDWPRILEAPGNQINDLSTVTTFGFIFQRYETFDQLQTYYIDNIRACKTMETEE